MEIFSSHWILKASNGKGTLYVSLIVSRFNFLKIEEKFSLCRFRRRGRTGRLSPPRLSSTLALIQLPQYPAPVVSKSPLITLTPFAPNCQHHLPNYISILPSSPPFISTPSLHHNLNIPLHITSTLFSFINLTLLPPLP